METLIATSCLGARALARSSGEVIDRIERDGAVVAISRRGRLVAVMIPVPDRLILELEAKGSPRASVEREPGVDLADLALSDLAIEFIIDAATTPTGYWHAPDAVYVADRDGFNQTLLELHEKGLAVHRGSGNLKITRLGKAVVRALREEGRRGYSEAHGL